LASAWVCAAITACTGGRQPEQAQACAEPAGVASSGAEQKKSEDRGRWVGVGVQAAGSGAPEARVRDHARYMHGRDTNMRQCDMVLAVGAHGWTACRKWKHQKTFEIFFSFRFHFLDFFCPKTAKID